MAEETNLKYYLDDKTLGAIVEALLLKIKEKADNIVTKGEDENLWNNIVNNLTKGEITDETLNTKGVSVQLFADVLKNSGFTISNTVITGTNIETAVTTPAEKTIYLLKDPNKNTISAWLYDTAWTSIGAVDIPEVKTIDVTTEDAVKNVVSHVSRGDVDFTGSTNVQPTDIVTAQSLTNTLVALNFSRKEIIPYSKNNGDPIGTYITNPSVNTLYAYQQSEDNNDWAMYTVIPVGEGSSTYVWLKISGTDNSSESGVSVDMSNYWSKAELSAITIEEIKKIVDSAAEKVGF